MTTQDEDDGFVILETKALPEPSQHKAIMGSGRCKTGRPPKQKVYYFDEAAIAEAEAKDDVGKYELTGRFAKGAQEAERERKREAEEVEEILRNLPQPSIGKGWAE